MCRHERKRCGLIGVATLTCVVALLSGCSSGTKTLALPETLILVVATDGDDRHPGTLERPFASIGRAKTAIRHHIHEGLASDVRVYLRKGTYYLAKPLEFSPLDSGTDTCSVIYEAYPGETAIISGGREISGWQSEGGNLWTTHLPDVAAGRWWFRQLWCDGNRCLRSRWPNPGQLVDVSGVSEDYLTITFGQDIPGSDLAGNTTELVSHGFWTSARAKIRAKEINSVTTETTCGIAGDVACGMTTDRWVYLEHHLDYVDQPTEWHLNPNTGVLTYRAPDGIDPNHYRFTAPRLEKLIVIKGSKHDRVQNLVFRQLSFKHTGWRLPPTGYGALQAGHYGSCAPGEPRAKDYILPLAIEVAQAERCRFERCRIAHTGQTAIGLGAGCVENEVVDCEIVDIGGTGIMVGWHADSDTGLMDGGASRLGDDWPDPEDAPVKNVIRNNHINDFGREWFGCVGIFDGFCKETAIVHNIVSGGPYGGISIGFDWQPHPNSQTRVLVKQNHVYDVMRKLADSGGIYTLGNHQGGVISGNLIHDVHRSRYAVGSPNNAIYFDNESTRIHVEENITYNVSPGDDIRFFRCNPKEDMTWRDNYWGAAPDDWTPEVAAIAEASGVVPAAPALVVAPSSDSKHFLVTGHCEPWARMSTARIRENSLDVTKMITVGECGVIQGVIPANVVGADMFTLEMVVSDPDGDLSLPGVSKIWPHP